MRRGRVARTLRFVVYIGMDLSTQRGVHGRHFAYRAAFSEVYTVDDLAFRSVRWCERSGPVDTL